jgi:transcriptional regulator with XRE-family HTH domain
MDDEHATYSPPSAGTAGARMRELRTAADMAQAALAEEMARRGFRWHQTTVTRIEAGTQELDLTEATAIAEIFAVPLGSLASAEVTS